MKRRIRIAAASVMVAAGLIGAVAAPGATSRPPAQVPASMTLSFTGNVQASQLSVAGALSTKKVCRGGRKVGFTYGGTSSDAPFLSTRTRADGHFSATGIPKPSRGSTYQWLVATVKETQRKVDVKKGKGKIVRRFKCALSGAEIFFAPG